MRQKPTDTFKYVDEHGELRPMTYAEGLAALRRARDAEEAARSHPTHNVLTLHIRHGVLTPRIMIEATPYGTTLTLSSTEALEVETVRVHRAEVLSMRSLAVEMKQTHDSARADLAACVEALRALHTYVSATCDDYAGGGEINGVDAMTVDALLARVKGRTV